MAGSLRAATFFPMRRFSIIQLPFPWALRNSYYRTFHRGGAGGTTLTPYAKSPKSCYCEGGERGGCREEG